MKELDPARLRRARLAELDYVRRDLVRETEVALARMRTALNGLRDELEKSRQLLGGGA